MIAYDYPVTLNIMRFPCQSTVLGKLYLDKIANQNQIWLAISDIAICHKMCKAYPAQGPN